MIKINQIKLPVTHSDEALKKKIIKMLKLNAKTGFTYRILKKSLDARKKPELFYTYSVAVEIEDTKNSEESIVKRAAFYRTKGISLLQAREDMYKKYGNYLHSQKSFQCEGASGMERMKEIMTDLRANPPKAIGGLKVVDIADYLASEETNLETGAKTVLTLPKSDVIAFKLEQGASVIIRPSGTEPKIKAYYTTIGDTRADAEAQEEKLIEDFKGILGF